MLHGLGNCDVCMCMHLAVYDEQCCHYIPPTFLTKNVKMNIEQFWVVEFIFDCGIIVHPDTARIADKEDVVSALCKHYLVTDILAELEQIRRGLDTLNFLSLIEEHPKQIMPIFQPSDAPLSAEQMEDLDQVLRGWVKPESYRGTDCFQISV